jgi:hypothetical protein
MRRRLVQALEAHCHQEKKEPYSMDEMDEILT